MKTTFPVYGETLANLTCSVIRYFGGSAPSPTLARLDAILEEKQPKNVVLALFDGMGANILRRTLPADAFLRRHMREDIYSIFPPTTVAAIAAVESGLYPASSGWLGWNTYIPEIDEVITTFTGTLKGTDTPAAEQNPVRALMSYRTTRDIINGIPGASAQFAHPFGSRPYRDFDELCGRVREACSGESKNFLYIYHTQPDEAEHIYGTGSPEATRWIETLNHAAEMVYDAMPEDSLLIVVADHGHIDSETLFLEDYPELFDMLRKDTSCEGRAAAIFLKEGCLEKFARLFNETFGDEFLLLTAQEVVDRGIFGDMEPHERFRAMIGDCMAIATGRICLECRRVETDIIALSNHAGITEDEVMVPFVVAEK